MGVSFVYVLDGCGRCDWCEVQSAVLCVIVMCSFNGCCVVHAVLGRVVFMGLCDLLRTYAMELSGLL